MSIRKKDQPYTSQLRGVAALIEDVPSEFPFEKVAVKALVCPSQQPRRYFDPDKQKQLVGSIKEHGILEPLLVRPLGAGKYELVAGERRYRAALEVDLAEVPVVIKDLSDEEALQLALVENLQRADLNPFEETEGILSLLSLHLHQTVESVVALLYRMGNEAKGKVTQNVLGNEAGQKVVEVFETLGTISWESFVSSRLPLRNLPEEILEALCRGRIAYTKAQAIARLKDSEKRQALLDEAIAHNLSLAKIKEKIQVIRSTKTTPTLKQRLKVASRRLYASKCWDNPQKQKKLEKLLAQMEALLAEE